jgi:uncharacterized delta-60 repeat protein
MLALAATAWGAAGSRDRSFGKKGFTIFSPLASPTGDLRDVLVLRSGKILAAGERGLSNGFLLARFKANGRPDRSFGRGGVRIQPFNGAPNRPRSLFGIDFDSRRRIVAAGLAAGPGAGKNSFGFARFLPNGARDTSFGDAGIKIVQPGTSGTAFDVAAVRGNKVVAAGEADGERVGVVRLNAVGQPDNSFGPGGIRSFHVPGSSFDEADAVLPLGNGPLLVGGLSGPGGFVVKLGDGGLPAAGFGTAGFSVHDFGDDSAPSGQVFDMAPARHGKILLAGNASAGEGRGKELFAARLKANGQLDPSFASGGVLRLDPTAGDDSGFAIKRVRNRKVLIAGVRGRNTWLVRLTAAGRLDRSFGKKGQRVASAVPRTDFAAGLAIDSKGRAVIAGGAQGPVGNRLLVGRFLGN